MSNNTDDGSYEVYWPLAPRRGKIKPLAARPNTLAGKKVAFLWDYLFRGDAVFALIEEAFKAKFPGISFVSWKEFGNTHGNDERVVVSALPKRLEQLRVDAVISGMGC